MKEVGRNDPCYCGSGKKMKKCCGEPKVKKGFNATLIQGSTSSASKLAGVFQSKISEKVSEKQEEKSLSEIAFTQK